MPGIPPVIPSDAEDVAWALQTADTLWKRTEHVDAIVWLRRAAQSAAEAEDDDRALVLARQAADLAEWSAHEAYSAPTQKKARNSGTSPVLPDDDGDDDPSGQTYPDGIIEVDDIAIEVSTALDPADEDPISAELEDEPVTAERQLASTSSMGLGRGVISVPTAAEKHAGLLDPWADDAALPPPRQSSRPPQSSGAVGPAKPAGEDVVTSARVPSPSSSAGRKASQSPAATSSAVAVARRLERSVDLSGVDAFADMPADVRERFARSARVVSVPCGGDCTDFVLAVVIEGSFDVSSMTRSATARRLDKHGVACARGTIEHATPMRLTAVRDSGKLAVWDDLAAQELVRTCPWVDDDLRAGGDLLQASVGLAMGPLGQRLDPVLRAEVAAKLKLRALLPEEVLATRGRPVPGLFVVGAGELELEGKDGLPPATVRAGEFLFPHEVLQASPAPTTVRAARGGALVLFAERGAAQELLVTCPPLLEIFAGM
jgi:hypothetical protein